MKYSDLFGTSLYAIVSQKLRTFLSMLWIIIWVITIILVVAIWTWAQKQVQEQFKSMSVNTIMVFPMRWLTFSTEDVEMLQESSYIKSVVGFYQSNSTVTASDGTASSFSILGITPSMFDIVSMKIDWWTMLGDEDAETRNVLLWYWALTQLFPDTKAADVIWNTVKINKKDYTVIGVFKKAWWGFGPLSFDDSVYVPLKTFEKNIARSWRNNAQLRITAIAKDTNVVAKAVEDMTDKINEKYEFDSTENKFRVIDAWSTVATAQENAKTLKYLLMWIASIVFLVSWIWIMNVMFASVAERTKEIWILKSIGADQHSILLQFLLESLMLTVVGSLIGVFVWELVIYRDPFGTSLPLQRTVSWDFIAVGFAMITWLFFWRYPAWKASKLDPVDALRS